MAARRPPWLEQNTQGAGRSNEGATPELPTSFEFLNDTFELPRERQTSFNLFPSLPLELRRRIWKFCLSQQRLLVVTISAAEPTTGSASQPDDDESNDFLPAPYQHQNELNNVISGANYQIHVGSTNVLSPLLFVSREANAVVRRIHRVRIPIAPPYVEGTNVPCLRFSPKRDTILLSIEREEDKVHFANFVHDAQAYDPKGKGILHIAITDKDDLHLPLDIQNLHPRAQAAVANTLRGLRSVVLIYHYYTKSRQMFSSILHNVLADKLPKTETVRFNRAYPLWSSAASYSTLPADPRTVSHHLQLVDCDCDPRRVIRGWRTLEAAYDVAPLPQEKLRVLLATTDPDKRLTIATRSQAQRFRQQEEESWGRNWEQGGVYRRYYPELRNPDDDADCEFSEKQNVVGFWSVPVEAFGPELEVPFDTHRWDITRLCDLTPFESQIELGLFRLP